MATQFKTKEEALEALSAKKITVAEAMAAIAAIEQAEAAQGVVFKVSEKGCISAYGMGRRPTTLYIGQWAALLDNVKGLAAFAVANKDKLAWKDGQDKEAILNGMVESVGKFEGDVASITVKEKAIASA